MTGDGRLKIKNALVSVSDKTGLEKLVTCLDQNKVSIFSTGGTAKFIESLGINVTKVSEITNFPEIMDGRVKTLNPLIYGGILNRIGIDDDIQKDDEVYEYSVGSSSFKVICDPKSLLYIYGMQLDFSTDLIGGGFNFTNPNASQTCGCGSSFAV